MEKPLLKSFHLAVSACTILVVGLIYGVAPSRILPMVFDFEVQNLELQNIFRAIMGLYWAFAGYWIIGILKAEYWKSATISNILLMGGLASGRLLSTILDGVSPQFMIALFAELGSMIWGIYNLKRFQ